MQPIPSPEKFSPAWEDNQNQPLTSEGFVEVTYQIDDPEATVEDVTTADAPPLPISDTDELADGTAQEVIPYATLEQNLWLLNGKKTTIPANPDDYRYSGYVSTALCNEQAEFTGPRPSVTIRFEDTVKILPGLTIIWGEVHGDYPTAYTIHLSDEDGHTRSYEQIGEGTTSIVEQELAKFNAITIEVVSWNRPGRRARIAEIFPGIKKVYNKQNLLSFSCAESLDPVSASLPKYSVQFEIDNTDDAFNPNNPEGLAKYMIERQKIQTRYGFRLGDEVAWIPGGVYYLSEWSAPQNGLSASFAARDLLGFMNGTYYRGKFAKDPANLLELAEDVLKVANLPPVRSEQEQWVLDTEALGNTYTTAPLPVASCGECLQLIANAAGCTIFFDRKGVLHIAKLAAPTFDDPETQEEYLSIHDGNSYSKAEISLTKPLKQVDVSVYSFVVEETPKELDTKQLRLKAGENTFLLEYADSTMAKNVTVSANGRPIPPKKDVNGAEYVSCYAKHCELVLWGSSDGEMCTVVFTGTVVKQTETIVPVTCATTGETQPLKNALITDMDHATTIGQWVGDHLKLRKQFAADWRVDPRLDAGDCIKIFGELPDDPELPKPPGTPMRVTSSNFSFSGAFKGKSEGVAIE